jgi:putative ATP-dependent endonuclease of the OLD family
VQDHQPRCNRFGARDPESFSEADFYRLDTSQPIIIDVTVGDLPPEILDLEAYSLAIRGWDDLFEMLNDEPSDSDEPVLTLRLTVNEDCEPVWCLHSARLAASGLPRDIRGTHRALISAQRVAAAAAHHLAWGPRSVLARLSEGTSETVAILAAATKAAQENFNPEGIPGLQPAIAAAQQVAKDMAVSGGLAANAALDARAISIGSGAVALHDGDGVPLRALGLGSSRLMAAGLQVFAAAKVPIVLFDEIEQGLEPHRIIRLLHRLGSKSPSPAQQVFMTTHSPVVLRELSATQLWKAHRDDGQVVLSTIPKEAQGILRAHPEAFLSPTVLVCEGATEHGLMRGLDIYDAEHGMETLALLGVALVNGGGTPKAQEVTLQFAKLGFRTGLLRDSDKTSPKDEAELLRLGGRIFCWDDGYATEDQLFASLPLDALLSLLAIADMHHTRGLIDSHRSACGLTRAAIAELRASPTDDHRPSLAAAAKCGAWFKRIDFGEDVGRLIVGPFADKCTGTLIPTLRSLWKWVYA